MTITAQEFHVVIEKGENGYYTASVVELPGCHTQAKNLNELDERVKEVISLYLEAEGENLSFPEFVVLKKDPDLMANESHFTQLRREM